MLVFLAQGLCVWCSISISKQSPLFSNLQWGVLHFHSFCKGDILRMAQWKEEGFPNRRVLLPLVHVWPFHSLLPRQVHFTPLTPCCFPVAKSSASDTPWTVARQASLSFTISHCLFFYKLKFQVCTGSKTKQHSRGCHAIGAPTFS